jgi:RNA polymerase sigma factor (sigma-70 family)
VLRATDRRRRQAPPAAALFVLVLVATCSPEAQSMSYSQGRFAVRKKKGSLMPIEEAAQARTPGRAPDPLAEIETSESTKRLLAILGGLPHSQQEVLRLRFQEDLSYKEISAVTRHSVGNVGLLIHAGLKQLRK